MENFKGSSSKNRLRIHGPEPEEGVCSDADEDDGPGRRWSIILIFAVVPLVVLTTILFVSFAILSAAFGAMPSELMASTYPDIYQF